MIPYSINITVKDTELLASKNNPKTRASVEYNGLEFVVPLLLMFNGSVNSYDELIIQINEPYSYSSIILFNDNNDCAKYVDDILKKPKIINSYIINFRNLDLTELMIDKIKCIYISGKKNKHNKINELNKGCNKKLTKSDIYIEYTDETIGIKGISVKQSADATKSNYSVHKLLSKGVAKNLTNIKKEYLKEHGFLSFNKKQRTDANKIFYPKNKDNPYWIMLRKEIYNEKEELKQQLLKLLYCSGIHYDVYECDGIDLTKLNKVIDFDLTAFEEHLPYYFDKSGKERETAKLFYRLNDGEKNYRVEIRWKGNVFPSPQFQIHNENNVYIDN